MASTTTHNILTRVKTTSHYLIDQHDQSSIITTTISSKGMNTILKFDITININYLVVIT